MDLPADAAADYHVFETLRVRAVHIYGRTDSAVCVLAGALAAYLLLVITVPRLLPDIDGGRHRTRSDAVDPRCARGRTAIRLVLWLRQRATLMRAVPAAYRRWTDALRDEVLRPFIVERRNNEELNPRLYDASIGEKYPLRLIEGIEPRRPVVTDAMTRVRATARECPFRQHRG